MMKGRPPIKEAPEFGKRLAKIRNAMGITQAQLAEKLGLSVKTIDHYERRCPNPSIKFVKRISEILDISVSELLGENKKIKKPGPTSKIEKQLESIRKLPKEKQKAISTMLDMALQSESVL